MRLRRSLHSGNYRHQQGHSVLNQSLEQIDCNRSAYVLATAARIFQKVKTISAKDVKFKKTSFPDQCLAEDMDSGDADAHVKDVITVDSRELQHPTWNGQPIEAKPLGRRSNRQTTFQAGQLML